MNGIANVDLVLLFGSLCELKVKRVIFFCDSTWLNRAVQKGADRFRSLRRANEEKGESGRYWWTSPTRFATTSTPASNDAIRRAVNCEQMQFYASVFLASPVPRRCPVLPRWRKRSSRLHAWLASSESLRWSCCGLLGEWKAGEEAARLLNGERECAWYVRVEPRLMFLTAEEMIKCEDARCCRFPGDCGDIGFLEWRYCGMHRIFWSEFKRSL